MKSMQDPSLQKSRSTNKRPRFVAYSDRDWAEIRSILKYHIGKDADAATVRAQTMATKKVRAAVAAIKAAKEKGEFVDADLLNVGPEVIWVPLRKHLEFYAQLTTQPPPPRGLLISPKQVEKKLKAALAELTAVADAVPNLVDLIKSEIKMWEGAESRSRYNAANPGQGYFLQLACDLWFGLGGDGAPNKVTRAFILACAKPVFQRLSDNAVEVWFRRQREQWPRHGQPVIRP